MESRIKNWPGRLQVCTDQLNLAIQNKDSELIDQWLTQGFEAMERCTNIVNVNSLDASEIDLVNKKITNFKLICKND